MDPMEILEFHGVMMEYLGRIK